MSQDSLIQLLEANRLKKTSCRLAVLQAFDNEKRALSAKELKDIITPKQHLTSIYRVLKDFLNLKLVSSFYDAFGNERFEANIPSNSHSKNHSHFSCSICYKTYCLDRKKSIENMLPAGFLVMKSTILIEGLCPKCQIQAKHNQAKLAVQH